MKGSLLASKDSDQNRPFLGNGRGLFLFAACVGLLFQGIASLFGVTWGWPYWSGCVLGVAGVLSYRFAKSRRDE